MTPFHALEAEALRGGTIPMSRFAGSVVLVVNTASKCGFTPQYRGLEALYQTNRDRGFVILGFPCNQFGKQEPGGPEVIEQTCQINYGVTFPMFAKVEVNGPGAHPLFTFVATALPGWFGRRIMWNFTKFLVGRDGRPLRRFAPFTSPAKLERWVKAALET